VRTCINGDVSHTPTTSNAPCRTLRATPTARGGEGDAAVETTTGVERRYLRVRETQMVRLCLTQPRYAHTWDTQKGGGAIV
jgi:hypothetical protein